MNKKIYADYDSSNFIYIIRGYLHLSSSAPFTLRPVIFFESRSPSFGLILWCQERVMCQFLAKYMKGGWGSSLSMFKPVKKWSITVGCETLAEKHPWLHLTCCVSNIWEVFHIFHILLYHSKLEKCEKEKNAGILPFILSFISLLTVRIPETSWFLHQLHLSCQCAFIFHFRPATYSKKVGTAKFYYFVMLSLFLPILKSCSGTEDTRWGRVSIKILSYSFSGNVPLCCRRLQLEVKMTASLSLTL